jgi:hypothetical protein
MLQANPTLTPNAVKAILQFTAQQYPGYDALTQGAGFLNARGAVDLARAFAASPAGPLPSSPGWSRQLIWGTHLVQGGDLTADANAWSTDVVWGSATTSQGQAVVWGTSQWVQTATNVVWGSTCGGADCQGVSWSAADSGIGGTSEEDTIVWGTTCDGSTCRPVIW